MPFFSTEVDRKLFPWRKWMTEKEPMCQPDQHILYTCYVFNSHPQCHLWFYQEQEAAFSPWNRNQLQSHGCKLYTHHIHIQNQASLLLIPWLWLKKLSLDVSRTIYICSMARQQKEWSKCRLRQSLRTWWSHIRSNPCCRIRIGWLGCHFHHHKGFSECFWHTHDQGKQLLK